jgi:hypothetical protein
MEEQNKEQEVTKKTGAIFPAVILLILGSAFLAANFMPSWDWGQWWPIFILVPGLAFYIWYFASGEDPKLAGILIPGSILAFMGLFFFIMNSVDWQGMTYLWPTFILIPGLAFFITYFGSRKAIRGMLIPASILTGLALIFYMNVIGSWKLWPLILIAAALFMLFRKK